MLTVEYTVTKINITHKFLAYLILINFLYFIEKALIISSVIKVLNKKNYHIKNMTSTNFFIFEKHKHFS